MNPFTHLDQSLSASRITTYLRCPLRYWFRYVERREEERVSAARILGLAVDQAIKSAVLSAKQGSDAVEPADLFLDLFSSHLKATEAPVTWPARYDEEKMRELGKGLMEVLGAVLLTEERLARISRADVSFTIPLLDGQGLRMLDKPLIGIFDFVEETDGQLVPLEIKTASTRTQYTPDHLERDLQALIYGLAARTMQSGGEARVRYVSGIKLKTPEVIESEQRCTEQQLAWAWGVIVGVDKAIESGVFVASPSVIDCGGCAYSEACRASCGAKAVGTAARSAAN